MAKRGGEKKGEKDRPGAGLFSHLMAARLAWRSAAKGNSPGKADEVNLRLVGEFRNPRNRPRLPTFPSA